MLNLFEKMFVADIVTGRKDWIHTIYTGMKS